ncbi:MAG TPA: phosphoglycerate mutase family protein [Gemmatimonadales bacterium]|nr:phosphoglycerate mutase family protein [Gemmatimonadales bacterium]
MTRWALLALLLLPSFAAAQSPEPVTIFVARHAERASAESDPPLSEVGKARAERLAEMLKDAGITHAFSTEFLRTRETVAPLAARLGLTATVVPGREMNTLISALQGLPPGSRVLVAGHSNTINQIAGRLSGQEIPALPETEYDRLYVVTIFAGKVSVVLLRY